MINNDLKSFFQNFREEIGKVLQSINGKIDILQKDVSGLKADVSGLKADVSGLTKKVDRLEKDMVDVKGKVDHLQEDMVDVKETLETNSGSLMNIELKLDAYGDMYEINDDHIQRLNKRVIKIENQLEIEPPDKLLIPTKTT